MMRIGKSTDIHRLKTGGTLKLGGVIVSEEMSTLAHSDGDCLIHAVAESLLGAAALGDLGTHFPDDDARFEGIDSTRILAEVLKMIEEEGYRICNVDCLVMLEKPRLKPHREAIRTQLADLLGLDESRVNVKATTAEGLGVIGEGKAIACEAVALLERKLVRL